MKHKRRRARRRKSQGRPAGELAGIFEAMMQQLTLLGHTLPKSAVSFTPQQLKILFTLDFFGEPAPMSNLSSRLGVTPGTLTRTAAGVPRKGYLEVRRSPDDERAVKVSLGRAGHSSGSDIHTYRQAF